MSASDLAAPFLTFAFVHSGINYDKPLPPIQVASLRAERIAKEKKVWQPGWGLLWGRGLSSGGRGLPAGGCPCPRPSFLPVGSGGSAEGAAAAGGTAPTAPAAAAASPAAPATSAPAPDSGQPAAGPSHRATTGPGTAPGTACTAPAEGPARNHHSGQRRCAGEQPPCFQRSVLQPFLWWGAGKSPSGGRVFTSLLVCPGWVLCPWDCVPLGTCTHCPYSPACYLPRACAAG